MPGVTLKTEKRNPEGTRAAKRLRKEGLIPAVVYGGGKDSVNLKVDPMEVTRILQSSSGMNTIIELDIKGIKGLRKVMITDYQLDPINFTVTHTDFVNIDMRRKMELSIPVETVGIPDDVEAGEGVLDVILKEIEIECLPADIPDCIKIEVGHMEIGDHIRVSDLELEDNLSILSDPQRVIVVLSHVKKLIEPTPVVEEEELLEEPGVVGEEEAEGEGEGGEAAETKPEEEEEES